MKVSIKLMQILLSNSINCGIIPQRIYKTCEVLTYTRIPVSKNRIEDNQCFVLIKRPSVQLCFKCDETSHYKTWTFLLHVASYLASMMTGRLSSSFDSLLMIDSLRLLYSKIMQCHAQAYFRKQEPLVFDGPFGSYVIWYLSMIASYYTQPQLNLSYSSMLYKIKNPIATASFLGALPQRPALQYLAALFVPSFHKSKFTPVTSMII